MKPIIIREARIEDSKNVAELLGEFGYKNTPAFAKDKIETLSKNQNSLLIVAELDREIVGVAQLEMLDFLYEIGKTARIITLIVKAKHRKQGVGTQLVNVLEEKATKADSSKIEVTSRKDREEAHNFYKNLGYEETSTKFSKKLAG